MTDDAAILATFADWRTVKGRKVLQLIFEVPLEDQAKVLSHLGAPMPMEEKWCGIARVASKGAKAVGASTRKDGVEGAAGNGVPNKPVTPTATKPKQRWSDMRPSARAAMLTKDPEFWEMLSATSEQEADDTMKRILGIVSKRDLDVTERTPAVRKFEKMDGDFTAYRQARGHGAL